MPHLTFATLLLAAALIPTNVRADERPACAAHLPANASKNSIRIACEIPEKQQYDVAMAEIYGTALRRHDIAAWLTTDELVKIKAFENVPGRGVGWVTAENDDSIRVWYLHQADDRYGIAGEATLRYEPWGVVDARGMAEIPEKERVPTPAMLRMLRARALATRQDLINCNPDRPFNTVVLPVSEDGRDFMLTFLMSAWDDKTVPLGGFHMLRIGDDGTDVITTYSQTSGCGNLTPEQLEAKKALAVAHDSSAAPTSFHVFLSLQYRKPLYVKTTQNGLIWKVSGATVSLAAADDATLRDLGDAFLLPDRSSAEAEHDLPPSTKAL